MAASYARVHRGNLISVGIVPLVLADEDDWSLAQVGQRWQLPGLRQALTAQRVRAGAGRGRR